MKKFLMFLCAVTLVFGMVGTASAVPWTWTDIVDPEPDIYMNRSNNSYSFTHDIRDDGFDIGSDLVTYYSLEMWLYDDNDNWRERAFIDLPGIWSDGTYNFSHESNIFGMSLLGWASLNILGTLDVTINRTLGDFYFDQSILTANGNGAAPVPEPGTILLMGIGLLGIVGYSHKRSSKKSETRF